MAAAVFQLLPTFPIAHGPTTAQTADKRASGKIGPPSFHLAATQNAKVAPDKLVAVMSLGTLALTAVPTWNQEKDAFGGDVFACVRQPRGGGLSIHDQVRRTLEERAGQTQRRPTVVVLHKLREQADKAARASGVKVDRLQHVELSRETQIAPLVRDRMLPAAKIAISTPISPLEEQDIATTVVADGLLRMSKAGTGQTP